MNVVYWVRGQEFLDLAKISIESIKKLGKCKIFVYTDDPTLTDPGLIHLEPGRPKMVANLDAQIHALCTSPAGERVLFLDADTIVKKPFPFCDADLFLTWRDIVNGDADFAKSQPFNYGVVGAIANAKTIEAFIWLRQRILKMQKTHQAWFGNQIAMFDLVGRPAERKTATIRWTLNDTGTSLDVVCLPCETWNYSPEEAGEDISAKGIIHCKGSRKDLMKAYA